MEIAHVHQILQTEGLDTPTLRALIPNVDNYKVLLMQPQGVLEVDDAGVRNFDRDLARAQFGRFLTDACATQPDLIATPEYAMPWEVLSEAIKAGQTPEAERLWALGCESISHAELDALKAELEPHATLLYEGLEPDPDRFLDPLAYIFLAPVQQNQEETKLVVLIQFKTHPMADQDHFEVNGMQRGTRIYRFGGFAGQEISFVSLICSDALAFYDADAQAIYDRGMVLHIQLNPKPRQDQFRRYRDKLLQFQGDATELICLNWASDIRIRIGGNEINWQNISGSAWYLKPDKFDIRDETLHANHKLGLYYTWLQPLYVHALFFNYQPATYLVNATKVAHVGVPAVSSRRRGPQIARVSIWDNDSGAWAEQMAVKDGFSAIVGEAGSAKHDIQQISDQNPFAAERVMALCAGKIDETDDWHKVSNLDSCRIDTSEIIYRLTFCQDSDQSACEFRTARLKRCGHLWDILQDDAKIPPALADLREGFHLHWSPDAPHQNVVSGQGLKATVVYLGEDANLKQVEATTKRIAEFLQRRSSNLDESLQSRQRLAVWYRDENDQFVVYGTHNYTRIDKTADRSEFDIGRQG
ncbi:hypothetical protein [Gimibacter soli]|uniref:Uncharacterized protein n=1 Tax=Gimibacter soli TaxID=3024400 RepID=A0AAF0BLP9_9PROT|nr:hypothetical protein [Gimibacter soli]WCL54422.1 hypothetical protein PH603_01445 [Gimibacter soli]